MVNRIDRDTARETQQPSNLQDQHYGRESARLASRSLHFTDNIAVDDVIASLANAHENRRARQVGEWERMPRNFVH